METSAFIIRSDSTTAKARTTLSTAAVSLYVVYISGLVCLLTELGYAGSNQVRELVASSSVSGVLSYSQAQNGTCVLAPAQRSEVSGEEEAKRGETK